MSRSSIEWTERTWNPIRARDRATGRQGWFCVKIAPECKNCYAERMNVARFGNGVRYAVDQQDKVGLYLDQRVLEEPLHVRKPSTFFVCSMTDLYGSFVPYVWIWRVYEIMALAGTMHGHRFQVLTKRPERRRQFLAETQQGKGITAAKYPHIWEGVSIGTQKAADKLIPILLQTPAAVRWISVEPLLEPIDLFKVPTCECHGCSCSGVDKTPLNDLRKLWKCDGCGTVYRFVPGQRDNRQTFPGIDWVVVGGESGPGARPMHPDWVRSLRDQCKVAGVPFFFKQWGEWAPGACANEPPKRTERVASYFVGKWNFGSVTPMASQEMHRDEEPDVYRLGKKSAGRLLDGVEHSEYPEVKQ